MEDYEPKDDVRRLADKYLGANSNMFVTIGRNPRRFANRMALMQKELIMLHLNRMDEATKARALRTLNFLQSSLTKE